MRQTYRWFIAVPLALVLLGAVVAIYPLGFFLGGMMTDSCSGLPGWAMGWLTFVWPKVMVTGALIPPVLIAARVRWRWVLLSLVVGPVVSAVCYLLWLPLLSMLCR